jgi:hypothetical protein
MKPISRQLLLRVKEITTMSLSSPWKLSAGGQFLSVLLDAARTRSKTLDGLFAEK